MNESDPIDPTLARLQSDPPMDVLGLRANLDAYSLANRNKRLPKIGASIDDVLIGVSNGRRLTVDIHQPKGRGPFPILVYFHGGGWFAGSSKTHRRLGFRFAEGGYLVFNVNYRLAPENPFPAAFEDAVAAIRWVGRTAAEHGGDVSRIAAGGDSAGGNLAAAACAALAGTEDIEIRALLLLYAVLDIRSLEAGDGVLPNGVSVIDLMVGAYCPGGVDRIADDERASPILAAERFPPTHVMCGTADGLMSDLERLSLRLADLGIAHEAARYEGMPHAFAQMEEEYPQARQSIERMIQFLNRTL